MNLAGKLVLAYCALTAVALVAQLIPGMPPIGFALFVVGMIPATVGLFFARF